MSEPEAKNVKTRKKKKRGSPPEPEPPQPSEAELLRIKQLEEERLEEERKKKEQEELERIQEEERQKALQVPPPNKYAEPLKVISCWPVKVEELYLGKKGFEFLKDLEQFPILNILWINGNKIKELVGLENNFRLQKLFAHENEIHTLANSSLKQLKYLEVLTLHDNQLTDLKTTIAQLTHLIELKELRITPRERVKAESIFKKTTTTPPRPVSTRGIILTPVEVRISKEAQKILQKQEKLRKLQEQQEIQKKLEEEQRLLAMKRTTMPVPALLDFLKNKPHT